MRKFNTIAATTGVIVAIAGVIAPHMVYAGTYYEFQGPVTYIKDYTPDGVVSKKYSAGTARYVLYLDTTKKAWWLSGATGSIVYPKNSSLPNVSKLNYQADYVCGNSVNQDYLGSEYHILEQHITSTTTSLTFTVGRRMDIKLDDKTINDLAVGDIAEGKDRYWASGSNQAASYATSNLSLIRITDTNPCE